MAPRFLEGGAAAVVYGESIHHRKAPQAVGDGGAWGHSALEFLTGHDGAAIYARHGLVPRGGGPEATYWAR